MDNKPIYQMVLPSVETLIQKSVIGPDDAIQIMQNSMANVQIYPTVIQNVVATIIQGSPIGVYTAIEYMHKFKFPSPDGFEFVEELGVGGCGKVYLAKHLETGTLYAVKCVTVINPYTNVMANLLLEEMKILRDHPHDNIIKCFGLSKSKTDSSITYLILEYMNMGSVKQLYLKSKFNEATVRECISQVLQGLVHLHSLNIVHRDIKGDNILKNSRGNYKIADFGLTKRCYGIKGNFGLMTIGAGTYTHMAPEVMNLPPNTLYNTKADIWSLGCLVLEMLNGGVPIVPLIGIQKVVFSAPNSISAECEDFVKRCLDEDPTTRYDAIQLSQHVWFLLQLSD